MSAPDSETFDTRELLRSPLAHAAVELAYRLGVAFIVVRLGVPPFGWAVETPDRATGLRFLARAGFHEPAGTGPVVLIIADEQGAIACSRATLAVLSRGGVA